MNMKKVTYDYDLGTEVKIKAINLIGTIDALLLDHGGQQYRLVYWNKGDRHSTWMYPFEIEAYAYRTTSNEEK